MSIENDKAARAAAEARRRAAEAAKREAARRAEAERKKAAAAAAEKLAKSGKSRTPAEKADLARKAVGKAGATAVRQALGFDELSRGQGKPLKRPATTPASSTTTAAATGSDASAGVRMGSAGTLQTRLADLPLDAARTPTAAQTVTKPQAVSPERAGLVDKLTTEAKQRFESLGITLDDLKASKAALPDLQKAAEAVVAKPPDVKGALAALEDAGLDASPVTRKLLAKAAEKLPAGVAKSVLSDPAVQKALTTDKALYDSVGKLFDEKTRTEGVRELVGNDASRDAALGALGKDPGVKAALAKVGLTPEDLVQSGKAAPRVWDAVEAFQKGDTKGGLEALQKAVEAAPELSKKLVGTIVDKLPQSVKDRFASLGITTDDLKASKGALPKLFDAADKLTAKPVDVKGALTALKDAALEAPAVTQKLLAKAAEKLPEGTAKSVLSDPAVQKALTTDKALYDSVGKLFDEKTRTAGVRELLGNDSSRDAVLGALGKDPAMKAALAKVGLSPEDLVQSGKAAPRVWDAVEAFQKGDTKGGLEALQKAVKAAPELSKKLVNTVVDKLPQGVKDRFASLGITTDDLKASQGALPKLFDVADKLTAKPADVKGALTALKDAALEAPAVTQKLLAKAAEKLPEGTAKSVLSDPAVQQALTTDKALYDSVGKLFDEKTRLAGARELVGNDATRDAVLGALGKDPAVKGALAKVGLTPEDLVQSGKAAPHVWDAVEAFQKGDTKRGLQDLQKAIEAAPELSKKLVDTVVDKLPQGVKDRFASLGITPEDLKKSEKALPKLFDVADKLTAEPPDVQGALKSLGDATLAASPVTQKLLGKLAEKLPDGVAKTVLSDPKVRKALTTDKKLYEALGKLFDDKTRMEGVRDLLGDDKTRNAVLGALGKDPGVKASLEKVGLTPQDLVEAGKAAPLVFDALDAAQKGYWKKAVDLLGDVGEAAPHLVDKLTSAIVDHLPDGVKQGIAKLGVTPQELKQAGKALPHLLEAAEQFSKGKTDKALDQLRMGLESAPNLVAKMVNKAAANLPDGLAKTLLTDPKLIATLAGDKKFHQALGGILSGTKEGLKDGLRAISADSKLNTAVADALWKDPKLKGAFQKLGFESAADVAEAGHALDDVLSLKEALDKGDWKQVVGEFGDLVKDLPEGLKKKVGEKIASTLKLPPGLADLVIEGGQALTDPAVRAHLGEAIDAFKRKDVGGFVKALGATGEELATKYPDAAVGFLDLMGKLPGGVGRFFSNHDLNAMLVKSGTVTNLFQATEKLAQGDMAGALKELGEAAGTLIGAGDHWKVGKPWPMHGDVELPFGEEGLKAMTQLFGQFVEALPPKVKAKVMEAVAKLTAKAGASIIPGGSLLGLIGDVPDLVSEIREDPKDGLKIVLKGSEVALDVAGVIPGAGAITGPLRTAVGVVDFVVSAKDLIDDLQEFKNAFAFG